MTEISSVERVEMVLDGKVPDRVPVSLHNFLMTAQDSGLPFAEFLQSGEAMAEGQMKAWREFGHDVLLLENGTAALAEACGAEVEYLTNSAPVSHAPAIQSLDDIDKLRIPDPYQAHPLKENLKATRIVANEIGNQAFIIGRADQGPFSLASMLVGIEKFLYALVNPDEAAKLHSLLSFCEEVVYRYAVAQIEQGARLTSIGESLSGPDVCSPKTYKAYEWGYAKKLTERLKAKDIRLAYHICGNATRIVTDMVETGAAILELDYKCDLSKIKAATLGKSTILGVLDPSGVLTFGQPEFVAQKTQEALAVLAPNGGLIVGPGCGLPPITPPANLYAMIETAHQYGRYLPDGQLAKP
ncbi:MAG: uroporphyrinogen decarboxylase family protein [Chloroflexi bacterium]|nr:uroporphyrinogen decarboxylase family protein [Chloroflexota bacterium]